MFLLPVLKSIEDDMKYTILIVFLLFMYADVEANNFLKENTIFKNQFIIDDDICYDINESTIDFVDSQLFFCEKQVEYNERRDSAMVIVRDISNNREVRLSYAIDEFERPGRVFSFACSAKYFSVNKYDELLLFDRSKNNELIYKGELNFRFNNMIVSGENLLCRGTWVDLSARTSTYFFNFSIQEFQFVEKHFFEDPLGYYFYSVRPRYCYDIDNTAGLTHYIASPLRYSIDVYDREYNKISNISRDPQEWTVYPDSLKLLNLLDSAKIAFSSSNMYKPFEYTDQISEFSSLIDKIWFVNEHLFVLWHVPGPEEKKYFSKVFIDIWKRNSSTQEFDLKEKDIPIMDGNSYYDVSNLRMRPGVVFKDGYVVVCNNNPFPIKEIENVSDSVFKSKQKAFYLENDLRTSIYLFEVNND